jgi:hypothetical protein
MDNKLFNWFCSSNDYAICLFVFITVHMYSTYTCLQYSISHTSYLYVLCSHAVVFKFEQIALCIPFMSIFERCLALKLARVGISDE